MIGVAALVATPSGDPLPASTEIYSVKRDGSGRIDLSNNPANDRFPVESPRGRRIAFVSDRDGYDAIYVMNDDGSDQRRLTDRIAHGEHGNCQLLPPVWSPGGSTIAFTAHCLLTDYGDPRQARNWIHAVSPSGGPVRELISNGFDPSYSADGRYLSFTHQVSPYANGSLALASAGGKRQVVFESGYAPAWSATGHRLAFVAGRRGVAVVDARRPSRRWLLGERRSSLPAWSPRGTALAFFIDGAHPGIYIDHPPQRRIRRLVDLADQTTAEWAPNGRWLALPAGHVAYVVMSDGRFLSTLAGSLGASAWSPDSSHLALIDAQYGAILVTKPRGEAVQVGSASGPYASLTWTADSQRLLYASDVMQPSVAAGRPGE